MARQTCLDQNECCPLPLNKRRSVGHHEYYYSRNYETPVEIAFRNLASNITQRCVCIELADPHTNPPVKPDLITMLKALTVPLEGIEYDAAA